MKIKKSILIFCIIFILLVGVVNAIPDGGVSYYNFDSLLDQWGSNDATNNGATSSNNYPVFNISGNSATSSFEFDGINDYINPNYIHNVSNETISIWFKTNSNTVQDLFGWKSGTELQQFLIVENKLQVQIRDNSSNLVQMFSDENVTDGDWHNVIATFDVINDVNKLYVDGILNDENNSEDVSLIINVKNYIGARNDSNADTFFNGLIDEIKIFNRSLTEEEIQNIYNYGLIDLSELFSITARDRFTSESINTFNATINTTFFETTNGTINTTILSNSTNLYNITLSAENYFDLSYENYNVSSLINAQMYQSIINISVQESGSLMNIYNWTLFNGSTQLLTISSNSGIAYLPAGNYTNLTLTSNDDKFLDVDLDYNLSISPLDNKSLTLNISSAYINITAKNIVTGLNIDNFSITLNNLNRSQTINSDTTNGFVLENLIRDDYYNVTIDAENFALFNNSILFYANESLKGLEFSLFTENAINISIYNEQTGALIVQQVNITLTGNDFVYNYTTSTGNIYVDSLFPDEYQVRFSSSDYTNKFYTITVSDKSFQNLNSYLSNNSDEVSFIFKDSSNDQLLDNVLVSVYRWVVDDWEIVESKTSNIIGKVVFTYEPYTYYKFIAQKNDYDTREFSLDGITDDEYFVKLYKSDSIINILLDVGISFSPDYCVEGENNLTITFNSPAGNLINYSAIITYPGGTNSLYGNNAIGEQFSLNIDIIDPNLFDQVRIDYTYTVSDGTVITRTTSLNIISSNSSDSTWVNIKDKTYGMGVIERTLIAVVIVMLISGFTFMVAGAGIGIVISFLIYGIFLAIGFIPIWVVIITFLVNFIILIRVGGTQ